MSIEEMKAVDIRTVVPDELVDVREISLDENLSKKERADEFARQVKKMVYFLRGFGIELYFCCISFACDIEGRFLTTFWRCRK